MEPDSIVPAAARADGEVMASVEDGSTLVIADITRDDAYLTVPIGAAASLPAWR